MSVGVTTDQKQTNKSQFGFFCGKNSSALSDEK
jgi:hypothetical protein